MKTDRPATSFDPEAALSDPGFTPGARHLPALLELLERADEEQGLVVERVLARAGDATISALEPLWQAASPAFRRRLARLLARLAATTQRATELLLQGLASEDSTVRRWAARGLGHATEKSERLETALLDAWQGSDLPLRKALVDALGKLGGERSMELLKRVTGDAELERRARRAVLVLARGEQRLTESQILLDAPLGETMRVVARSRAGLSALVREELAGLGAHTTTPATVELSFGGTLGELYRARIALDFAVRITGERALGRGAEAVAALVTSDAALRVLRAWTRGPLRFRLEFERGGHRRADVWKVAELVAARTPELTNDPRDAPWGVFVSERLERDGLLLIPRGCEDPRFAYRRRDVPAASHPTLAAALARVAGVQADDVVWDPFVGSGLELVERARLGPYRHLLGSDQDARALVAASDNLKSAGIDAELERGDALRLRPEGVTLILTNPPMGRRVARDGSIGELLTRFVAHASRVLGRGGRLVWLSSLPELTREAGARAGLRVETRTRVDMQGFDADLQIFRRS